MWEGILSPTDTAFGEGIRLLHGRYVAFRVIVQIVAGRACRSKSQIASRIIEHNVAADSSQHRDPRNSDMHVENPTITNASMNRV
jgi:hypothetical protein